MEAVDKFIGFCLLAFACYICFVIGLHAIGYAIVWFFSALATLFWPFALFASWIAPGLLAVMAGDAWHGSEIYFARPWCSRCTPTPRQLTQNTLTQKSSTQNTENRSS